jgi:hypothetical protein
MPETYTLNQIVKQITTLGNDHEQINFVYFGDVWERLSNGEVTYPAMFYTLTGATINAKNITYNLPQNPKTPDSFF